MLNNPNDFLFCPGTLRPRARVCWYPGGFPPWRPGIWACLEMGYTPIYGHFSTEVDDEAVDWGVPYFQTNPYWSTVFVFTLHPLQGSLKPSWDFFKRPVLTQTGRGVWEVPSALLLLRIHLDDRWKWLGILWFGQCYFHEPHIQQHPTRDANIHPIASNTFFSRRYCFIWLGLEAT